MHSHQTPSVHDVIISGAGSVGLFLACELALAKCSVLILEKADNPQSPLKQIPFGLRGLSAPTIEALYRRGLLDELDIHKRLKNPHQNSGQGSRRQVGHFAGGRRREDWRAKARRSRNPARLRWDPSLKALATEYAEMKYVSSRAKEQLGLSAVLIRPDGYVAWASDSEPDEQSIRQAAALWLAPVPPLQ